MIEEKLQSAANALPENFNDFSARALAVRIRSDFSNRLYAVSNMRAIGKGDINFFAKLLFVGE
jgi:hypothetical protein